MQERSFLKVIVRRFSRDWKLLASVFVGVIAATTLAAATPVYLDSLRELSFKISLNRLPEGDLSIGVTSPAIPLTEKSIQSAQDALQQTVSKHLAPIHKSSHLYLRTETSIVGLPDIPLPESGGKGIIRSRGYLQNLSNMKSHLKLVDGRMASNQISVHEDGAFIEVVIGSKTSDYFQVGVGDDVFLSPKLGPESVISARIIGVVDSIDGSKGIAEILDPPPLSEPPPLFVQVDPEEPPLPLFVAEEVLLELGGDLRQFFHNNDHWTYLKGSNFIIGDSEDPLPIFGEDGLLFPLGFIQHLSNLDEHVFFKDGSMAEGHVHNGIDGPEMEAVISSHTARGVGLSVGDVVFISPTLGADPVLSVTIVGIFEPQDTSEAYWTNAIALLSPEPLDINAPVLVQTHSEADPIALFVTRDAMVRSMELSYPGSLVTPTWFVIVDKKGLNRWHIDEARNRLLGFEDSLGAAIHGSSAGIGLVSGLTDVGERRALFSSVPLLIILSVLVATVLVLLSMMISYLTRSRENDVALLKTRGADIPNLFRLYAVEGVAMAIGAVLLAPLLSISLVALSGLVPPFKDLTQGNFMPVRWEFEYFIFTLSIGLVCMFMFVMPSILGSRGVLAHRIEQSRPMALPFVHRYYIDIGLMVVGGLVYWEMQQRGNFVTSGIFKNVEVNETLFLAPVLFMIVVALLFVRLFPLIMQFISADSDAIVHLLIFASATILFGSVVYDGIGHGGFDWVLPAALVLAECFVYWITLRFNRVRSTVACLVLQIAIVAGFTMFQPVGKDQIMILSVIGLGAAIFSQFMFLFLKWFSRISPAWIFLSLLRMSRDPLQYTWLVLLLVLVAGSGVFATTVGATLARSYEERLLYEAPSDFRVSFSSTLTRSIVGDIEALTSAFNEIPGVTLVTHALRTTTNASNHEVNLLAVDPVKFDEVSWYREDFSSKSLGDLMGELIPAAYEQSIPIPLGSVSIGLWAKPLDLNIRLPVFVQIKDAEGLLNTVYVGDVGPSRWTLLSGNLPENLKTPSTLTSVLIFQSDGIETPGSMLIDDIHVVIGEEDQSVLLEGFEAENSWLPLYTSLVASEQFSSAMGVAHSGSKSGRFSFGSSSVNGLQGFYHSRIPAPLPIVVSSSFVDLTGHVVGDKFSIKVRNRWMPVKIKAVTDYFPTLSPEGRGFIITNFDHLLDHTNVLLEYYMTRPNELFVTHTPEAYGAVRQTLNDLVQQGEGEIYDGTGLMEELYNDPYVTAGWKPIVMTAVIIGVLAIIVGYITYLLLFAMKSGNETGSLQSMGLSRAQVAGLVGFEHLTISVMGLALGIWAGFQMTRLMLSPLSLTETGETLLPPFQSSTNWGLLVPMVMAIIVVFLVALAILGRNVGRRDLHTLTKV